MGRGRLPTGGGRKRSATALSPLRLPPDHRTSCSGRPRLCGGAPLAGEGAPPQSGLNQLPRCALVPAGAEQFAARVPPRRMAVEFGAGQVLPVPWTGKIRDQSFLSPIPEGGQSVKQITTFILHLPTPSSLLASLLRLTDCVSNDHRLVILRDYPDHALV